jgi:ketosteroid isomerase-like protein
MEAVALAARRPERDTARAMSEENVEIVRRVSELVQEGVRRHDVGGAIDEGVATGLIPPNCEVRGGRRGGAAVVGVGDEVGRDGMVEFMRTWTEDFSDFSFDVEQTIDAGENRVVVIQRQVGTGKASGVPVEMHTATIFRLDSRQVVRVDLFLDPAKALEAAGLRE